MKNPIFLAAFALLLFCRCSKSNLHENIETPSTTFKKFVIPAGEHYATENIFKPLEISEVKFVVKFDSSAVYKTVDPENRYDINKLWGFADNGEQHQKYSARFGWRWSDGALRLFAYMYNNGVRDAKELSEVAIGKEINCSIKVAGEVYIFSVDGKTQTMPRGSTTITAKGYQLYPYFGGDEVAPHEVRVWVKE